MSGKDIIIMRMEELKRLPVIQNAIEGYTTEIEAANILGITDRQIRRLKRTVREKGGIGLAHKSRGKESNRAIECKKRQKIIKLCQSKYEGFGPTFASEKLIEIDKVGIHPETLRLWFKEEGIAYKQRKVKKHRNWRERRTSYGKMVQMDGSHHKWFEERAPKCVLIGHIDDAMGKMYGNFYEYEGTKPFMDSFKKYVKKKGIPQQVYLDMHATYKSPKKASIEEELNNQRSLTQVGRALKELGVDIIYAHSPQAKGRIERSFETHQDRLVKELRLAGIDNIKDANKFLHSYYWPKHNRKFAVKAKDSADVHMAVPKGIDLNRVFSIKNKASLRNDFTVQYKKKFYQILEPVRAEKVVIEERLDGKIYIYHKDKQLKYKVIAKRPQEKKRIKVGRQRRKVYIPPKEHPFKSLYKVRCA